jgi:predicted AlkP superfamily pyrophosphatase or phosphodiesterase
MNKITINRITSRFTLLAAAICIPLCEAFATQGDPDPSDNYVILISIDGFAAYHLEKENLQLPNIRALIEAGVWATNSLTVYPSVTHPSHATLITGVSPRKHGVIGNEMTDRNTGKTIQATTQTRANAIHVPTLFDAAHQAGLKTAGFCWPETRQDASIDFNILHGHEELSKSEVDAKLLQRLRDAGIPIDTYYDIAPQGRMVQGHRDFILAQSAVEIFRSERPRLMAVHFSATDGMQHSWGPDNYFAHAALSQTDYNIGLIRQAVHDAGLDDRTTFVIVADHGFHSVNHEVNLHPVLAASGLAGKVKLRGSGWSVFAETTSNFSKKRDGESLETFFTNILKLEGIDRVIRNEDFNSIGYPRYEENVNVQGQFLIVPEINTYLVVNEKSTSTTRQERRFSHSHGYMPDHPRMYPALVMSGYRIKKAQRIGSVRNHDVAPTIASLLGISMPDVEGKVLTEALENK